jgi:hypothetical protein
MRNIGVIAVFFVFISTNFGYFKERRSRSVCRCSVADNGASEGEDLYIDDVGEGGDGLSCDDAEEESEDGAGCEGSEEDPTDDGAGCESSEEDPPDDGVACESSEEYDDEEGAGCESSEEDDDYIETEYAFGCACAPIEEDEENDDDGYLSPEFYDAPGADETGAPHRDTGAETDGADAGQDRASDTEEEPGLDAGADASDWDA